MENLIVKHCAPTLAGIKTANLVNCKKGGIDMMCFDSLSAKGVQTAVLAENDDSMLLYVYRRNMLENDLKAPEANELLSKYGYSQDADSAIDRLRERIKESPCFPHEIGLFLGYPANDVKGFIEHKGQNFKCMGYWKVYGDECEAKKTFARYKKCIDVYTKVYLEGASLERLTVAV